MKKAPPWRRLQERLGYRVAFILAIVLLPLTLISVMKSLAVREESLARSEAALMGETMRAASAELRLIQQARGSATVLANAVWPMVHHPDGCAQLMERLVSEDSQYSLIAYVPENGISTCNSAGTTFDFAADPLFQRASTEKRTSFAVKAVGLVSRSSVLVISHPVFDEAGSYRGLVSLSLPHSGLRIASATSAPDEVRPLTMITYDATGSVLTSSRSIEEIERALPRDRALAALVGDDAFSFSAESVSGEQRIFSVVPLVPNELYALGSWPPEDDYATSGLLGAAPILFPVLMWIVSLIVAWLAAERLVNRHIRKLSRSIKLFASGNRMVGDIDVRMAPIEIREMAGAYERMTETILHDEAEMEDIVHQKEVLLREVHHRVKNNLQLIASIMNMQMRRTHSAEAKSIMKGLQDRVMSLATIHRELYQTAGLSDIHTDELLASIVRQITSMADRPDRRLTVHSDFADIRMTPDQAVPMALLVSEAVTNAIKYSQNAEATKPAELWVRLTRPSDTRAELTVGNTISGHRRASPEGDHDAAVKAGQESGLGTQLLSAFAMQLGGTVERTENEDTFELKVNFELRPLSDGEERNAAAESA
ncbi:sensor histidine kinase [Seohaeicola nanhaiensis]|uniref:histidine kinase n=1 Tax=Seohaeicola nanhaiensis TaxID=1387282 RepID=A0ABV9KED6_9RHOB